MPITLMGHETKKTKTDWLFLSQSGEERDDDHLKNYRFKFRKRQNRRKKGQVDDRSDKRGGQGSWRQGILIQGGEARRRPGQERETRRMSQEDPSMRIRIAAAGKLPVFPFYHEDHRNENKKKKEWSARKWYPQIISSHCFIIISSSSWARVTNEFVLSLSPPLPDSHDRHPNLIFTCLLFIYYKLSWWLILSAALLQ